MEYNGEGIEALVAVVDDLQNAGLIMADKKIKALLKCLAYYDEFRTVLAYCGDGFDYAAEKRKAFRKAGDYHVLRLPDDPKVMVPLVARFLVECDDGTEDFITFCADYYPASSRQESIVGLVVEGVKEDVPLVERTVDFAPSAVQKQTGSLLVAIVRAVEGSALTDAERDELRVMLEGCSAALDSRDTLMIKAVWLGVRRALAAYKLCPKEIAEMDEILRLYLVSK